MTTLRLRHAALPVVLVAACGGGDEDCGPGEVTGQLVGTVDGTELRYGEVTASPNNDCSVAGAPVSLTLEARQEGTGRLLVFCLPRPDQLEGSIDLGDDRLQLIDLFADADDCLLSLDRGRAATGQLGFAGVCANGTDPAGFALSIDASIPVVRSCPEGDDELVVDFTGEAPVTTP